MPLTREMHLEVEQNQCVRKKRRQIACKHDPDETRNLSADIIFAIQKSEYILVDEKNKIIICCISNVACTAWKVS